MHNSIVTSEARFTDNHSKKFDYRIGKNYREKNYDSNHYNLCSKGLHSGSFDYIESMRLGDQIVYCIVNPMNVVAVADNATKVRSSELFIAGAIEESNWLDFKGKLENGVINFDNVDEQFEKNYEGLTIEYNSVDSTKPRERHILSEDELEEEKDDYDYELDDEEDYDQDEEDLRDELMDSIKESEEILKTYAEKVERFKRMLNERC